MDFGKKIVENFWNLELVRLPQDIFKLNYNKIEKLEGWGKLSVANLKFSIEEKKNISLERFIYSLGIRHIGQEKCESLLQDTLKHHQIFLDCQEKVIFKIYLILMELG